MIQTSPAWMPSSRRCAREAGKNLLRHEGLCAERRPIWNLIIPFDQGGGRPGTGKDICIKRPHRVDDRRSVRVDQQRRASIIRILIVAAKMNFLHAIEGKGVQVV